MIALTPSKYQSKHIVRPFVSSARFKVLACCCFVATLSAAGCAATPYQLGSHSTHFTSPRLAEITEPQVERGQPRPVLDAVGWVIGIPDKILMWDHRVANHNISCETEEAVLEYLGMNELTTVKVRLNQYAPIEDWRRLRANDSVGFGWRYTLGTLSWLGETLLPGRVFGYDHYNPFTNTIYLFSDVPAIGLHEAAHAKDFARREFKGTYAALYVLPIVPLWHEGFATSDVFGYLESRDDIEGQAEAYRILYPAYGSYAGDAFGYFAPEYGGLAYLGGVIAGHVVGRTKARQVLAENAAAVGSEK